jgi:hypothetical protein
MQYLITGKLARADEVLRLPHEEFVQLIKSRIAPTLQMLVGENSHGKVIGGGMPAGGRDFVMIVDLKGHDSHRCVRQFLWALPLFPYYDWDVTPLESFQEMAQAVQG